MPTFMAEIKSQPIQFQQAIAALRVALQGLTAALSTFRTASDIQSWNGPSREEQKRTVQQLAALVLQVVRIMEQAGTTANAGAATMQAQQTALVTTVNSATSSGYFVTPNGQARLGPTHYQQIAAAAPHGSGPLRAFFQAVAAIFSMSMNTTVAQTTMTDAQVAMRLVALAAELISTMSSGKSSPIPGASAGSLTTVPGSTVPGSALASAIPGVNTDLPFTSLASENALTGADRLAGAGGPGGISTSNLGGATGINAQRAGLIPTVASGTLSGGTAAAGPGGAGGQGGAAGRAGAGMTAMPVGAGMGAGVGSTGDADEHHSDLVDDDRDVFAADDSLPGPVVG